MRQSMLSDEQAQFLREEKDALSEIRLALAELDVPRESLTTLQDAILQLDELFLLVVVGEFNAGKSALVNALLGERVLPEQGMFGDKETVQQRLGDGRIVRFAQAVIGD